MVKVGPGSGGNGVFGPAVTSEIAAATLSFINANNGILGDELSVETLQSMTMPEARAPEASRLLDAGAGEAVGHSAQRYATQPDRQQAAATGDDQMRATVINGLDVQDLGVTGQFRIIRHRQSGTEMLVFRQDHAPWLNEPFARVQLLGSEDQYVVGFTSPGLTRIFATGTRQLLMQDYFDRVTLEEIDPAMFDIEVKEDGVWRRLGPSDRPRQLFKMHRPVGSYVLFTDAFLPARLVPLRAPALPAPAIPPTAQVVPPTAHSLSPYEEAMARYIGIPGMRREETWQEGIGKEPDVLHLRWTSMGALLTRAPGAGFPVIREVFPQGLTVFGANDEYAYGAALRDRSGISLSGVYSTETGSLLLECSFDDPPTVEELEKLMEDAADLIEKK